MVTADQEELIERWGGGAKVTDHGIKKGSVGPIMELQGFW